MTQPESVKAVRTGSLIDPRHVGYCYELRHMQHHRFRDRVTVYYDGMLFFERYCYGESAGLTGSCWATGLDEDGHPHWVTENVPKVVTDALPVQLGEINEDTLRFVGSEDVWDCIEKRRRDAGYSLLKRKLGIGIGKK